MNPYEVLCIDEDATPEVIEHATFRLFMFWSQYLRVSIAERARRMDDIAKAYKMLMPMIPPHAMNGFLKLHEVNETYLNSLKPADRRFYEMVVDYYALPLPG